MAHKIERAVLAQRIRELDGLTNDERSALLELLNTKKFGLVWENKPEDVEERLRENLPILKEVKEKALTQGGADAPNHIIIEGDNLEALTALTYTHEGKIDVIYIDPPYNTGNKDFVYNDNYVDAEDGYRHSKWLSFMSRRLKIAKRLLSDKGVIFISIDENELPQLKLLSDEIFGNKNYIACVPRKNGAGAAATRSDSELRKLNDYILIYKKTEEFVFKKLIVGEKKYDFEDKYGYFMLGQFQASGSDATREARPNMWYPIYVLQDHTLTAIEPHDYMDVIYPKEVNGKEGRWLWSKDKFEIDKDKGLYFDGRNIFRKIYFDASKDQNIYQVEKAFLDEPIYQNSKGTLELNEVFGRKSVFDHPKPTSLLKWCLNLFPSKNITILDFFAGSGTTLHATMQLNEEDKGHRQCILVTNNENNICEEVTYERNKRVINGYTTSKGVAMEGLHGNNLRYYKVGFVPRENTLSAKRQLMAASTDLLCIKNGIYTEQSQFGTLALKPNIARYFEENGKRMLVIFREEAIEKLVAEIKRMTLDEPIITYVFSSNNYAMDADFEEVEDKVSLCALPAAIYNAYLKVLPKRKAKNPENEDAGESGESMEEQQKLDFGEEETL